MSEKPHETGDLVPQEVVTTAQLDAVTRSEIDIQITTAKRFPRSIEAFKSKALSMATLDEVTAQGCFYSLPRGGKPIEGPSVRLAEIIASSWGNLRAESRIIDDSGRFVVARAVCFDLETNVAITKEVRRRITDKRGKRYSDDMIGVTANAAASIALRNAVFAVVPHVYTDSVYREAKRVAIGDATTLVARRASMIEAFGKMGVTPPMILGLFEKTSLEDIDITHMGTLQGLYTALRDGDTTIDETFAPKPKPGDGKPGSLGDAVKKHQAKKAAKPDGNQGGNDPNSATTDTPPPETN